MLISPPDANRKPKKPTTRSFDEWQPQITPSISIKHFYFEPVDGVTVSWGGYAMPIFKEVNVFPTRNSYKIESQINRKWHLLTKKKSLQICA